MNPQSRLWSASVAEMPSSLPLLLVFQLLMETPEYKHRHGVSHPTKVRGEPLLTKVKWCSHIETGAVFSFCSWCLDSWLQGPGHRWYQAPTPGQVPRINWWGLWSSPEIMRTAFSGLISGSPGWENHCPTPGSDLKLSVLLMPILGAKWWWHMEFYPVLPCQG